MCNENTIRDEFENRIQEFFSSNHKRLKTSISFIFFAIFLLISFWGVFINNWSIISCLISFCFFIYYLLIPKNKQNNNETNIITKENNNIANEKYTVIWLIWWLIIWSIPNAASEYVAQYLNGAGYHNNDWYIKALMYLICIIVWFIIWILAMKFPPKTESNYNNTIFFVSIGIIICIFLSLYIICTHLVK